MKIYIVTSFDEMHGTLGGETGHNSRIMKAFDSEEKAHEFMAECGYQLEQWEKTLPTNVEDEDINQANYHAHCEKHPFVEDGGYFATGFECHAIELE